MTAIFQRIESSVVAAGILITFVVVGLPWWALLATFLLFDLSMLGYLWSPKLGAWTYNLVHNYAGPALLAILYVVALQQGTSLDWMAIVAGCWGFHVAADRALGYGLKSTTGFAHTHLGIIGPKDRTSKENTGQ